MKKHYQKYCMHLAYAIISTSSFLFTTKTFGQEKLNITPELSKKIIENFNIQAFKIYPVLSKEIEYYPYVDGEVPTIQYKNELRKLEQYKSAFDEYNNAVKLNSEKKEAIKTISQNIDTFLSSDEKYDVKEKLLIDSQALADKYEIKIEVVDDRIKLGSLINTPTAGYQKQSMRFINLYEKGKKANKNDLKTYKSEISHYKIAEPEKTHYYRMYLETTQNLSTIRKTESGKVLSDKPSKKSVLIIEDNPIDISSLSGEFIALPDNYMLTDKEIPNRFIKNQVFTEKDENYQDSGIDLDRFSIIKKSGTNEQYYIMSDKFMYELKNEIERIEYQNLGSSVEYKTWKTNYLNLMQSAQTNINACNAIIKKHTYLNRIGQKKYDSDTFSKQEKATFNQNLDSLKEKLDKIGELEDKRKFLTFYNDKGSIDESIRSYNISNFYNTTSRCY